MDTHETWRRLNRHGRRRQARLADFAGGSLDILRPVHLLQMMKDDPAIEAWVHGWFETMATRRPLCLTCEAVFDDDHVPMRWAITSVADQALLSGICADCSVADDLIGNAVGALRREGMEVRTVDPSAFSPQGGSV